MSNTLRAELNFYSRSGATEALFVLHAANCFAPLALGEGHTINNPR